MPAKILVIDNVEFARTAICLMLTHNGFEVESAASGKDGIKKFQEDLPVLVLTDILMPEMEGIEIINSLQNLHPEVPIIAMTDSHNSFFLETIKKLGATKGILKPFKQECLINMIRSCLELPASP